jgi:hypothetical protein
MTVVLLILAFVFFLLACIPKVPQPFNFIAAGLMLWELAQLIGGPVWPVLR